MDRLLDLGFEQTILEILSTIRGERLPGLKDREVCSKECVLVWCSKYILCFVFCILCHVRGDFFLCEEMQHSYAV